MIRYVYDMYILSVLFVCLHHLLCSVDDQSVSFWTFAFAVEADTVPTSSRDSTFIPFLYVLFVNVKFL